MRTILLDTNAFTSLFLGDQEVLKAISVAEHVIASVIVIGELETGFRGGTRYRENIDILERFLAIPNVETGEVTRETSECFGMIKDALRKKGAPVPVNDIWIAAQAIERGAVVVTNDRHFSNIAGLRVLYPYVI
ncbi:MAG: type II toxin-antitoxin system VapC family toxin [Victivallales bacterium]|nr:type II toxin-antitoxin system VapC family toxin [Victivallales bacterium]